MKKFFFAIILGFLIGTTFSVYSANVETKNTRVDTINPDLQKIGLSAISSTTPDTAYYTSANKTLRGKSYTQNEYDQTRREFAKTMRENKEAGKAHLEGGDLEEKRDTLLELLNQNCAGKSLSNIKTMDDIIAALETGC